VRPDQIFTEDVLNLIHTTSRGYPRAVNNLALQSLVAAFAASKNLVDEAATRSRPARSSTDTGTLPTTGDTSPTTTLRRADRPKYAKSDRVGMAGDLARER
jgi:hypothetical protein